MTVFSSVAEMSTDLLAVVYYDLYHRGTIGSKSVCDDGLWRPVFLHRFLQKPKRRWLVAGFGDIAL